MRSTIRRISSRRRPRRPTACETQAATKPATVAGLWLIAAGVWAAGGCSELVNPLVDDLPATGEVSTASVTGIRDAHATPAMRVRDYPPALASAHDGTVSHWPLWWEDPFVDKGSEDGRFAWTEEDCLAIPYGLGRFLLNIMGWPVSAVVTPPPTVMGSDGVLSRQALGYDHDATRLPGGLAPPLDILEVGTIPPHEPGPGADHEVAPPESPGPPGTSG
ncbi:MAG: hypothetical protein V2A79_12385 [Planctomycetota bacterium]